MSGKKFTKIKKKIKNKALDPFRDTEKTPKQNQVRKALKNMKKNIETIGKDAPSPKNKV